MNLPHHGVVTAQHQSVGIAIAELAQYGITAIIAWGYTHRLPEQGGLLNLYRQSPRLGLACNIQGLIGANILS